MKKFLMALMGLMVSVSFTIAQRTVSGTVTDNSGEALIGANVLVQGTTSGTITDFDGKYQLNVPDGSNVLIFSYTGYGTLEVELGASNIVDMQLSEGVLLEQAVVTALGISRDKKSLGYATQEVQGDALNVVQSDNFVNALSGKVAGINITRNNNMGGSSNVTIRGNTSLTGSNQALFVIDGVPISNRNSSFGTQEQAASGYDYGNAASDINPNDIESINVLKGAAATALYGSRASSGVIMITTKKGRTTDKGIGLTISTGASVGSIDKSTFPTYQEQYGAGYGPYYDGPGGHWYVTDFNGDGEDDLVSLVTEDGSYGAAFDPSLEVYQWDAFDPASPNYLKKTPWVNAENGPITFFETPKSFTNSVSFDKGFDNGSFRVSYTNMDQGGLMPNSSLKRNNFSLATSYDITDRMTVSGYGNFIKTDGLGRNSTGYSGNLTSMFRQWWQTNVDLQDQKDAYLDTKRNLTWNYGGISPGSDVAPIFWDNPYWQRHENFESDERKRFLGNLAIDYKLTDWLTLTGRVANDSYNEIQENRKAIGSIAGRFGVGTAGDGSFSRAEVGSGYSVRTLSVAENNYDLMLKFNTSLSDMISLNGVVGSNTRRQSFGSIFSSTSGGLFYDRLYSLNNSVGPLPLTKEVDERRGTNSLYAQASLGFNNMFYIDGSIRRDHSSTLPAENAVYYYPAVAASILFTDLVGQDWLSFGKLRLNYAQVGLDAEPRRTNDVYSVSSPFNTYPRASVGNTKRNPDLLPEKTNSLEAGVEMFFMKRRIGLDISVYKTNSTNQIFNLATSPSTGYTAKVANGGEIENKGVEVALFLTPIKSNDFSWDIGLNWARNRNEVLELADGLDNIVMGSFQGGITLNATKGQPYGVIQGTDYTFHENGSKLVSASTGEYQKTSTSDNVIGDVNPDWVAGLSNTFRYKNLSLSFLIDMKKGGDIFSLDLYYGLATGLYEETAFTNDLGNPVRNSIADGGGFINEGVNADGNANATRIRADRFGAWGYRRGLPNKAFVYDAGFIKLREIALSYDLPSSMFSNNAFTGISVSLVGSNVYIFSKGLPHADPESGLGSGNLQGYSTGSLPTTRDLGINVKFKF